MTGAVLRLPLDLDVQEEEIVEVAASRADLRTCLRLNALDFPLERLRAVPFPVFCRRWERSGRRPGFLFHLPFTGSTLLAALLNEAGTLVVRDPAILDGLYLDRRTETSPELAAVGRATLACYADLDRRRPVVIRTAGYRPAIVERLAAGPGLGRGAVFICCDWRAFVAQVLKTPKRAGDMQSLAPGARALLPGLPDGMAGAAAAAAFWLEALGVLARLIDAGQPIRVLDARALFANPAVAATAAAASLGARPAPGHVAIAADALCRHHAKTGARYGEPERAREEAAAGAAFRAEIDALEAPMRAAGAPGLLERLAAAHLNVTGVERSPLPRRSTPLMPGAPSALPGGAPPALLEG